MVELRLESLDAGSLPQDCYVSVRVGETQKLSKLNGLRTLRFPSGSDRRLGKIEVFKRVGACSIEVDPATGADRELRIGCSDNIGELGLRVHLEGDSSGRQEVHDLPGKARSAKMKGYQEYLSKHGLEVLLSEAMAAVLRQRPDQPLDFLVEHLKQHKPFSMVEKLVPAPVAEKAAPAEAQDESEAANSPLVEQGQIPAAKQAPPDKPREGAYYATHVLPQVAKETWSELYVDFPQARKPEKTTPQTAPTPSPASVAVAAAPVYMSPSVGTWLVSKRRAPGPTNPTVPLLFSCPAASSPAAATAASAAAPVAAPTAAVSAPSACPASGARSASSAAAVTEAPRAPPSVAPTEPATPWPLKPSVGTWLTVAPKAPTTTITVPSQDAEVKTPTKLPSRGVTSLMKGFRSGEVAQIIDAAAATCTAPPGADAMACQASAEPVVLVKTCRSLMELGSPKAMTLDQRVEVERIVCAALLDAGGSLAGEYFPLQTSKSFAMRPGGMSDDEQRTLVQAGLLFKAEDADGRGVFVTSSRDAAVWLNAHDHHVTFVAAQDCKSKGGVAKLDVLEDTVNEAIRLLGYTLS